MSVVKALVYLEAQINFYPHIPYISADFGETAYDTSVHNTVEYFASFVKKSLQARSYFRYGRDYNYIDTCIVKPMAFRKKKKRHGNVRVLRYETHDLQSCLLGNISNRSLTRTKKPLISVTALPNRKSNTHNI
jgi:hypothetical protein